MSSRHICISIFNIDAVGDVYCTWVKLVLQPAPPAYLHRTGTTELRTQTFLRWLSRHRKNQKRSQLFCLLLTERTFTSVFTDHWYPVIIYFCKYYCNFSQLNIFKSRWTANKVTDPMDPEHCWYPEHCWERKHYERHTVLKENTQQYIVPDINGELSIVVNSGHIRSVIKQVSEKNSF